MLVGLGVIGTPISASKIDPGEGTIKIGVDFPLTGPLAMFGELAKRGVEMAIEDINKAGGINGKKLVAVYGDNKGEAKEGVTIAQRFITQEGIKIIISTPSPVSMAIKPITEQNKVLHLGLVLHPDLLTNTKYTIRVFPSAEQEMSTLGEYLVSHKITPIALFVIQDEAGKGREKALLKTIRGKIKVAIRGIMQQGQTDFRTQIAKVKALKIKNIVIIEYGGVPTVSLMKQAKEFIPDVKFFSGLGLLNEPVKKLSPEITNGAVFSAPAVGAGKLSIQGKEFAKRYQQKFNAKPGFNEIFCYDAVMVLAIALKKAKSIDPLAIKREITRIRNYKGVSGLLSFLPNGDIRVEMTMASYRNGQVVPIAR
jgi:branched-chain amino acid transport system substrate-binding protein